VPVPSTAPTLVVLAAGLARRYGGCKPLAPVGPSGDAVIDLVASDALDAGFGRIVLVLHPETGPAIRYHVRRCWPAEVPIDFAVQRVPLGTTHATLAARDLVDPSAPFAIANADDVYGSAAMGSLVAQLTGTPEEHALVGFEVRNTVVSDDPVTRGVCEVDARGFLRSLDERKQVARTDGGERFTVGDGRQPTSVPGDSLVSVNLWGFQPGMWDELAKAMAESGLDEETALGAGPLAGGHPEVLLPVVVGDMVADGRGLPVRVLATDARCIGVTHPDDLPVARAELARQVAWGTRDDRPWRSLRP